jgi:hypothetical protein
MNKQRLTTINAWSEDGCMNSQFVALCLPD